MTQLALFWHWDKPPLEQSACICCGVLEAHIVEEAATFKDKGGGTPCVSIHWHCDACDSDSLTLREQESPWIRLLWKLPPPEPSKRRRRR